MGYMNYYLDDLDIIERRNFKDYTTFEYSKKSEKKELICPYCQIIFNTNEALYDHIKKEHYISECTLIINNKVLASDEINYLINIDTFNIILYKDSMPIFIDDVKYDISEDIEGILRKKFVVCSEIKFEIGNKLYILKRYSVELINTNRISKYIENWNLKVSKSMAITNVYGNDLNMFEKRYLDGLYNYFIATKASKREKGERYIDAFGILNEFNPISSQGLIVLKIISFRLNWIDILSSLCDEIDDQFKLISFLYNGKFMNDNIFEFRKESYIFIEDEIMQNINAIVNFVHGKKDEVDKYLNSLIIEDIDDINLRDRILMLKAMRCIDIGKKYRFYVNDLAEKRFIDVVERYKEVTSND